MKISQLEFKYKNQYTYKNNQINQHMQEIQKNT